MDITKLMNERYSAKKFDETKKITDEQIKMIEESLRLAPSSVNSQPWHFIILSSNENKERVTKSTVGDNEYNAKRIRTASHIIIMCAITNFDDKYLSSIVDEESKDGRFRSDDEKANSFAMRLNHISKRKDSNSINSWIDDQVHINLGCLLVTTKLMGIDSLTIGGFDKQLLSDEFKLDQMHLRPVVMVALGFHAESDFNSKLKKSRLPKSKIITELK